MEPEATEDAGVIPPNPDCYKDFVGCPSEAWQTVDGSCSCYLYMGKMDAFSGAAACRDTGAHLVVIEAEAEDDGLIAGLKLSGTGGDFIIGLLHSQVFPIWVTDETTAEYLNLAPGPVDLEKDCARLDLDDGAWHPEYCNSYDDIVCELDGKLSTLPIPPTCYKDSPGCPNGWQSIGGSCSCYALVDRATAEAGSQQCRELGAHLIVVETRDEQAGLISDLVGDTSSDYYIGLVRGVGQQPQWVTGIGLAATGFDNLESDIVDSSRRCVQMDVDGVGGVPGPGHWRDENCGGTNDIVCELDGMAGRLDLPLN